MGGTTNDGSFQYYIRKIYLVDVRQFFNIPFVNGLKYILDNECAAFVPCFLSLP